MSHHPGDENALLRLPGHAIPTIQEEASAANIATQVVIGVAADFGDFSKISSCNGQAPQIDPLFDGYPQG